MSNISDHLANELIDHALRNSSYTPAATVYVALYTTDPGDDDSGSECANSGAYARKAVTFSAAASRATTNSGDVDFDEATGSWGTVSHVGIKDSGTYGAGNLLAHGAVDASKPIASGDTASIAAGDLDFEFTASA